jgi:adenylate kinase
MGMDSGFMGTVTAGRVLIFFGPPGSGKGTQAARLASILQVPAISTGDILRRECESGSALGQEVASMLSSGRLVSDHLISEVVAGRLRNADCASGCILDGYPRTVSQARCLDELLLKLGMAGPNVLDFVIPSRQVISRLEHRRQCARCGRIVSVGAGRRDKLICEVDGTPLIKRADDYPKAIRERLRLYEQNASELVRYYRQRSYHRIRADRAPDDVTNQIVSALNLNPIAKAFRRRTTLAPRTAF